MRCVTESEISPDPIATRASKIIRAFTAVVYLFTALGPTISFATSASAAAETFEEKAQSSPAPKNYTLKIDPNTKRDGIHFHLSQDGDPEHTLDLFQGRTAPAESSLFTLHSKQKPAKTWPDIPNFCTACTPDTLQQSELWGSSAHVMCPGPINDMHKSHFTDSLSSAWENLATHLQGAFMPLLSTFGLDQKESWDFMDYTRVASHAFSVMHQHRVPPEKSARGDLKKYIRDHLEGDVLNIYGHEKLPVLMNPLALQNVARDFWSYFQRVFKGDLDKLLQANHMCDQHYATSTYSIFRFMEDLLKQESTASASHPLFQASTFQVPKDFTRALKEERYNANAKDGFTARIPGFGRVHCDWEGNLQLVGLAESNAPFSLTVATSGTVKLSHFALETLSLKATTATIGKDVTLKGNSVLDIDQLNLKKDLANAAQMQFLRATKITAISSGHFKNNGTIEGSAALDFSKVILTNSGSIHTPNTLSIDSGFINNDSGNLLGDAGTTITAQNYFYNAGGTIGSDQETIVNFHTPCHITGDLGTIQGDVTRLMNTSKDKTFVAKNGVIKGKTYTYFLGNVPVLTDVSFQTPQLAMDVADFNIGDQGDVGRTVIRRSKTEGFKLTTPYRTRGTLEFWQTGIYAVPDIEALMAERFGDETGKAPVATHTLELQALVQADKGLKFYTPHARVRLGENKLSKPTSMSWIDFILNKRAKPMPEFLMENAGLTAYATVFDVEKAAVVASHGFVHAPGGIKIGRLVRDETRDCFATFYAHGQNAGSHSLGRDVESVRYTFLGREIQGGYDGHHLLELPIAIGNGTTVLIKNQMTFKGPLQHKGNLETKDLVLDTPKDSTAEASRLHIGRNLEFFGKSNLTLKRHLSNLRFTYFTCDRQNRHTNMGGDFICSDPAELIIGGKISGKGGIINHGSMFHAHEKSPEVKCTDKELKSFVFQKFFGGTKTEREALHAPSKNPTPHPGYHWNSFMTGGHGGHLLFAIFGTTRPTNYIYINGCLAYAVGFLQATNNFEGAEILFPAQTSFGTGVSFGMGDDSASAAGTSAASSMVKFGGNFSAPAILVSVGESGATIGTVSLVNPKTYSQFRDLSPQFFNTVTTLLEDNLHRLMTDQPSVDTFFAARPRFWFEATEAQLFHKKLRPFVRIQKPRGGFATLEGQAVFALSPSMLIEQVQADALEVLGKGTIKDGCPIDEDQVIELHQNMAEYLENNHLEEKDLARALISKDAEMPMLQKPVMYYVTLVNAEGIATLAPRAIFPTAIHKSTGIDTRLLLTIPRGMSFGDMLDMARGNHFLGHTLNRLLEHQPQMLLDIEASAGAAAAKGTTNLATRDPGTVGLPGAEKFAHLPRGELTLQGDIKADTLGILNLGQVNVHAHVQSQDILLMSIFSDISVSSLVQRFGGRDNYEDVILQKARLEASKFLRIMAGGNVLFQGAETQSGMETRITALAKLLDIPVILVRHRTQEMLGKYKGTESFTTVTPEVSSHKSGGEFIQESGEEQQIHGAAYEGAGIRFSNKEGNITFSDVFHQQMHSYKGKKSGTFSDKSISGQESSTRSQGSKFTLTSDKGLGVQVDQGDLSFTAPQFVGPHKSILRTPNGRVEILAGRNTFEVAYMASKTGALWNAMTQASESHLTYTLPTAEGPVEVHAQETLVEALHGQHLAFLDNLDVQTGSLINQVIFELHEHHSETIEGPGMALAVVVAVVVACCTGGAGGAAIAASLATSMGGGAAAVTVAGAIGTAFTAAVHTGLTTLTLNTMSAKGDLGKGLDKTFSSETARAMGTNIATAVLTKGAVGESASASKFSFESMGTKFVHHATRNTISAGVNTVINGADFQETFFQGLKTAGAQAFVNTASAGAGLTESIDPFDSNASFGEIIGSISSDMIRDYAAGTLAGQDPKDAFAKSIATAAAKAALHGIKGGLDAMVGDNAATAEGAFQRIQTKESLRVHLEEKGESPDDIDAMLSHPKAGEVLSVLEDMGGLIHPPAQKPVFHASGKAEVDGPDFVEIPWGGLDGLMHDSSMGAAYAAHYDSDSLRAGPSLSYDAFVALSEQTERLKALAQANPEIAELCKTSLHAAGFAARAAAYGASIFGGAAVGFTVGLVPGAIAGGIAGASTVYAAEEAVGVAFTAGLESLGDYAYDQGRTGAQSAYFEQSVFEATEAVGAVAAAFGVRGLRKGAGAARASAAGAKAGVKAGAGKASGAATAQFLGEGYHVRNLAGTIFMARNPGRAADLPALHFQNGKPVKVFDVQKSSKKINGNTRTSEVEATLYGKFDKNGKFEKWGISKDPDGRYTKKEMAKGELRKYRTGPRDQMLDKERKLTERFPGPENKEPWAGATKPENKGE